MILLVIEIKKNNKLFTSNMSEDFACNWNLKKIIIITVVIKFLERVLLQLGPELKLKGYEKEDNCLVFFL